MRLELKITQFRFHRVYNSMKSIIESQHLPRINKDLTRNFDYNKN